MATSASQARAPRPAAQSEHEAGDGRALRSAARRIPLTDRVNVEPPILNGMTASEAKAIGLASLALWAGIGVIVAVATGYWQAMLVFGIALPAITVWMTSSRLASFKRNRPDGYYRQALHRWCAQRGLAKPRYLTHSGYWSLGRSFGPLLSSSNATEQPTRRASQAHASRTSSSGTSLPR